MQRLTQMSLYLPPTRCPLASAVSFSPGRLIRPHPSLLRPAVVDALLWRDPKLSGAILAGTTVVYILLQHSGRTLLSLTSYGALVVIFAFFFAVHGARLLNRCVCSAEPPPRLVGV